MTEDSDIDEEVLLEDQVESDAETIDDIIDSRNPDKSTAYNSTRYASSYASSHASSNHASSSHASTSYASNTKYVEDSTSPAEEIEVKLPHNYSIIFDLVGEPHKKATVTAEEMAKELGIKLNGEETASLAQEIIAENDITKEASPEEQIASAHEQSNAMIMVAAERFTGVPGLAKDLLEDPMYKVACRMKARQELQGSDAEDLLSVKPDDSPSSIIMKRAISILGRNLFSGLANGNYSQLLTSAPAAIPAVAPQAAQTFMFTDADLCAPLVAITK
jgi:hypothetical protein